MTTNVHTIHHEDGAFWSKDAWDQAPKQLRLRLSQSPNPVILVSSKAPFGIVAANKAWQERCGYGAECLGQSPKILHGELTDMKKAAAFRKELLGTGVSRMTVTNYGKTGDAFVQRLRAENQGAFYFTEGEVEPDSPLRRACLKTPSFKDQMSAVGLSLALMALVLFLGAAPAAMTGAVATHEASALQLFLNSDFAPEAIPTCACFLLAVFVLTIQESTADKPRPRGQPDKVSVQAAEMAVGAAAVHCLACVALEAPLYPLGGPAAFSFVCLLRMLAPREEDWDAPNDQSRPIAKKVAASNTGLILPSLRKDMHPPLVEIIVTCAACLTFVLLANNIFGNGPPQVTTDGPSEFLMSMGLSGMAPGLFFA